MNKIVIRRPGGFERMKLEAFPDPEPGPGEVLVRTRGIGVNYADCIARMGLYKSANQFVGWPLTPGFEFSGEVLTVGAGVTDFAPGNRVLGVSRFGAYADRIVVHPSQLVPLPEGLSFERAGGFQVAFLTAWYGLVVLGAAREGSTVLVHSAAGGVGSALCQLGRSIGARVLGVVGSSDKVSYALAQGAAHVIDKSATPHFSTLAREFSPRGFDLVLDANGASTLRKSFELLAPMGRLVAYGFASMISRRGMPNPFRLLVQYLRTPRFNPLEMVDRNVAVFAFNLSYLFEESAMYRSTMTELMKLLSAGKIDALPVVTHPLAEAGAAHRALQSGRTTGKLVLVPSS